MDKKNIILLGFAIVAIGLFVIPSTMSMFVGQHRWYSVRTAESQYDMCARCHQAEVGEWNANTGAHATYKTRVKASTGVDPGCFCHQISEDQLENFGFNAALINDYNFEIFNETGLLGTSNESWNWTSNGTSWRSATTPHAAITINCEDCHYNATDQLQAEGAAHKNFFEVARNASIGTLDSKSNNTACLACHTMVGLNITMQRVRSGIIIAANHTNYTGGSYGWDIDVTVNQTNRSTETNYYWYNTSYNASTV